MIVADPTYVIQQINNLKQIELDQISNQTQAQLLILQQRYYIIDKVSSTVNIVAIIAICLIYVMAILSDLANLCPMLFAGKISPTKALKLGIPGAKRPEPKPPSAPSEPTDVHANLSHVRSKNAQYDFMFFDVEAMLFRQAIQKKMERARHACRAGRGNLYL